MEQTTTENTEAADADVLVGDKSDKDSVEDTIEEAPVESKPVSRGKYKLELSNSDEYQQTRGCTKGEPKSESKKSSDSRGKSLDNLVESNGDVPIDEERKIVPIYKGRSVYGEGYSMPTRFVGKEINESKSREVHDSFDAAHVIIYHRDPKTGKLYIPLEIKPDDYPIKEFVGKASLYGGSLKIGESPIEGLPRELKEEDPSSYKIIIKALNESRYKVAEITKLIDGVPSTTYIWAAEIKDPQEWNKYTLAKSTEGAKAIPSLEEIMGMKDNDFAFGFGPIVKGFGILISEKHGKISGYSPSYHFNPNNIFSSSTFQNLN